MDADALAATQEIVIEGLSVGLLYDGDESIGDIVYFTQLGTPAPHRIASVYKTMLEANNLWIGTGGSTLGNILASSIPLKGVDMGNAILAMHSCRETGSVIDHEYCVKAFTKFYQL